MSPKDRSTHGSDHFPVGSLALERLDAPPVGSLDLGSPVDLDSMMNSLPKNSSGKVQTVTSILGKSNKKKDQDSPLGRASTAPASRFKERLDAMAALK